MLLGLVKQANLIQYPSILTQAQPGVSESHRFDTDAVGTVFELTCYVERRLLAFRYVLNRILDSSAAAGTRPTVAESKGPCSGVAKHPSSTPDCFPNHM